MANTPTTDFLSTRAPQHFVTLSTRPYEKLQMQTLCQKEFQSGFARQSFFKNGHLKQKNPDKHWEK
jgi:hypothetical protein